MKRNDKDTIEMRKRCLNKDGLGGTKNEQYTHLVYGRGERDANS